MKGRVIKEGRRLAVVRSGDPGLHGARGLGLSWALGLAPTLAGGGGGQRGPLTGPSLLGTQPWLSTPGWCTRAATHMPHGWPTHPEHASRRAVQAGPGRERATANRHADAQLAGARGDARRVRDRADTRGHTHGTHTGSQATGRAPCSCCPMGTRPCSPVASAPDAEGRTAGPRGLGLAPGRRAGQGHVYSAGDGPARLTGFLTARSCPTAQGGRPSRRAPTGPVSRQGDSPAFFRRHAPRQPPRPPLLSSECQRRRDSSSTGQSTANMDARPPRPAGGRPRPRAWRRQPHSVIPETPAAPWPAGRRRHASWQEEVFGAAPAALDPRGAVSGCNPRGAGSCSGPGVPLPGLGAAVHGDPTPLPRSGVCRARTGRPGPPGHLLPPNSGTPLH